MMSRDQSTLQLKIHDKNLSYSETAEKRGIEVARLAKFELKSFNCEGSPYIILKSEHANRKRCKSDEL